MRAVVQTGYGGPEVLEVREVETPRPGPGEVLVRVHAAAINAGDCFTMRGNPWMTRLFAGFPKPRGYVPGFDVAGIVEAVGEGVTTHKPGDEVFGEGKRGMAEYACALAERFVPKPERISFEQAGATATAASTALRGIRDAGTVEAGQKVLVNGASGGVGTFAVQIAKARGAEVTGVCSGRNEEMLRSIGADHVIDYTKTDFTEGGPRYDLIFDNVANRTLAEFRRALKPSGLYLPNSGNGGLIGVVRTAIASMFSRQIGHGFIGTPKPEDLVELGRLMEAGDITPVVGRAYPLDEVREAFAYAATGHASGKVILTMAHTG